MLLHDYSVIRIENVDVPTTYNYHTNATIDNRPQRGCIHVNAGVSISVCVCLCSVIKWCVYTSTQGLKYASHAKVWT